MTRDEELLNEIIQRRGYIVVAWERSLNVGDSLGAEIFTLSAEHSERPLETAVRWYVIGITHSSDMKAQQDLAAQLRPGEYCPPFCPPSFNYYRVLSD